LYVLSSKRKLKLQLQHNNSKKFESIYNKIILCKKMKLSKNSLDFARNKVDVISQSKTWKIWYNYRSMDITMSLFHFFRVVGMWTCNLHHYSALPFIKS
jgi:hypothetical protein